MREIYSRTCFFENVVRFRHCIKFIIAVLSVQLCINQHSNAQDIEQMKKLIGENRGVVSSASRIAQDYFGYAVAVDGDYAIVGAYQEDEDENGEGTLNNPGSAYIYKKNGNTWEFYQKIVASNRAASDAFGCSVAIDGNYIVVGARAKTQSATFGTGSTNATRAGAAYIFKLNGNGVWEEQQEIMASSRGRSSSYQDAWFGMSVAIKNGYIVVGTPQESFADPEDPATNSKRIQYVGAAYIFKQENDTWTEVKRLYSADISSTEALKKSNQAKFGSSVAINNNYVFIGEIGLSNAKGVTHIYKLANDEWTFHQKINAADEINGNSFGRAVAISDNYAIVSAPGWKDASNTAYGSAYIFKLNALNNQWEQYSQLQGDIGSATNSFGVSVAINETYAIVGNNLEKDGLNLNHGVAYIYNISTGTHQKLIASDRSDSYASGSQFATSFALDNNQLFVGAWNDGTDENSKNYIDRTGAAYVFNLNNGSWNHQQKLVATDKVLNNNFGYSVATSGDYAVVGTPLEGEDVNGQNPINGAGKAYIFKRSNNGSWVLQQEIVASDRIAGSNFGWSVAIKNGYAIVGASKATITTGTETQVSAGVAYIFKLEGEIWVQQAILTAETPKSNGYFGWSVSITENHAVVGAYLESNLGAVYVFKNNGDAWILQQKLTPSETLTSNAYYGISVAIDGSNILAGAPRLTLSGSGITGNQHGKAFLFTLEEDTWQEKAQLQLENKASQDHFGISVAIKGDYAIVGAHQRDPIAPSGSGALTNAGAAYIFKKQGNNWELLHEIVASDREGSDLFGYSVAINNNYAIVGAYQEDDGASTSNNSGAVYIFKKGVNETNEETWTEYQKITTTSREAGSNFGFSVAIDDYIVSGAHLNKTDENDDNSVTGAGAAYIFGIPGQTLPVQLTGYTAKAEANSAKLEWETTSESNNNKFVIYRSTNNLVFEQLTEIEVENSASGNSYVYYDRNPSTGNNYYKLTQVDTDGKAEELGVRFLYFGVRSDVAVSVYPNPATDKVMLDFVAGKYNRLIVSDLNGRTLQHINVSATANTLEVSVDNYAAGLYLLKFIGDTGTEIQKVIKK